MDASVCLIPQEKRAPQARPASPTPEQLNHKRKASSTGPAPRRRQKGPVSESQPSQPPNPTASDPLESFGPSAQEQSQSSQTSEVPCVPPGGPGPCGWQDIWLLAPSPSTRTGTFLGNLKASIGSINNFALPCRESGRHSMTLTTNALARPDNLPECDGDSSELLLFCT